MPNRTCPTCAYPLTLSELRCPRCGYSQNMATQQWGALLPVAGRPLAPWILILMGLGACLPFAFGLMVFLAVREDQEAASRPTPLRIPSPGNAPPAAPAEGEEMVRTDAGLLPRRLWGLALTIPCGDRPLVVAGAGSGHGDTLVMCEQHHSWYFVDGRWMTYLGWQDRVLQRNRAAPYIR